MRSKSKLRQALILPLSRDLSMGSMLSFWVGFVLADFNFYAFVLCFYTLGRV